MGTDIHPAVEVRKNGAWRFNKPKTLCRWWAETWDDPVKLDEHNKRALASGRPDWVAAIGDRRSKWDKCKYALPEAFSRRNYTKFAVLGNVRNGYGFAGITTFEPLQSISDSRGQPIDSDPETIKHLSGDHSETWVTLQELLDYDWTQSLDDSGVISEAEFLDCLYNRHDPKQWSGGISGQSIEILEPKAYFDLFGKRVASVFNEVDPSTRTYDVTKRYYINYHWSTPVAVAVPDILEMIEYLKGLVPKGGTPDDVRVVMDFDS